MKEILKSGIAVLLTALIVGQVSLFAGAAEENVQPETGEAVPEEENGDGIEMYDVSEDTTEDADAEVYVDPVQEGEDDLLWEIVPLTPASEEKLEEIFGGMEADGSQQTEETAEETRPVDDAEIDMLSEKTDRSVISGFDISVWSSKDTYKKSTISSRNADGTNTYTVNFFCDADEDWIDENVEFVVENVTPAAIQKMYGEMNVACTAITSIVADSAESYISVRNPLGGVWIHEPFTEDGPGDSSVRATSGKLLSINTDPGVRAIKVSAVKNGEVLDYTYLGSNGKDSSGSYSDFDVSLNEQVRKIVESRLWSDDMSNLEKLKVMADYINTTTHYPSTAYTSKEYNPTFWENWSVDDVAIFYGMFDDVEVNQIMKLQGGVTTCQAVQLIQKMATDDLGLAYLYDGTTGTIADGEGVWRVTGSYSTNPTNPNHESLVYQDADGNRTYLDAQGMGYNGSTTNAACEAHGCREKLVSLNTIDLSGGTVEISGTDFTYDGTAKTPGVTVTCGSKVLTGDIQYTLSYSNNVKAGTASVTVTGTGDYSGTLTAGFTIAPKTVTASISGNTTKAYDGTASAPGAKLSLSGAVSGDDVSVEAASIEYDSPNAGEAARITASSLTLIGEDAGNYVLSSDTASAAGSITKAVATIDFAEDYSPDKSYDREPVAEPSVSQLELSGVGYSDVQFTWYKDGEKLSDAPVDPGSYSLKAWVGESENFTAAEAEISFTISKATMTATVADTIVTYGGELETVRVNYQGSTDLPRGSELEGILKFSTDYAPGAGVGTYTIKISGLTSDYFDIIYVPGTLTVEPRELTVDWSGVTSRVYGDGKSVTGSLNPDEIYGSDDVDITVMTDKEDHAGNYTASAELNGAKKDNYTLANGTVSYKLAQRGLSFMFTYKGEKVYDGTTDASVELTVKGMINNDEVTVSFETAAYNSPDVESADSIIVSGIKLGGKDADNYWVEETNSLTARIVPRSLDTLDVDCENEYVYGGTQYAKIQIHYNETDLIEGTDYTVRYFRGQDEVSALTDADTYTVEITGTGNYTDTYSTEVTVAKAATSMTVTADSKTYDGQPAEVSVDTGFDVSKAIVAWYDADGNKLDSAPVHAGSYTVEVTLKETENYTGATGSASFEISPAVPTVTLADTEATYTGEPVQTGEAVVTIVNGEIWQGGIHYTYTDQDGNVLTEAPVSAGTYTVTASVDASGDYTAAESEPATLTILAAEMGDLVVTVEGYNGTYDGNSHCIHVVLGGDTDGVRITYSTQEDGEYTEPEPAFKEAGDYTVYYRISKDNYADLTGSVSVHIAKAAQTVSYGETTVTASTGDPDFVNPLTETQVYGSITYTSSNPSVATVDENGTVTVEGPGTTTITASVSGTDSYDPAEASYVLTVAEAAADPADEADSDTGDQDQYEDTSDEGTAEEAAGAGAAGTSSGSSTGSSAGSGSTGSGSGTGSAGSSSGSDSGKGGSSPQTGDIAKSSFPGILAAAVVGTLGLAAAVTAGCTAVQKCRKK